MSYIADPILTPYARPSLPLSLSLKVCHTDCFFYLVPFEEQARHGEEDPAQRCAAGRQVLPVRGHSPHGPVRLDLLQGQGRRYLQVITYPSIVFAFVV